LTTVTSQLIRFSIPSFKIFDIAGSGLSAQSFRINTVSSNLANAYNPASGTLDTRPEELPLSIGDGILAVFRHQLTDAEMEVAAAQLVVEHGTTPMDEVFNEMRASSSNVGVTDVSILLGTKTEASKEARNGNAFELHRIGDAVASRDIYSAIYEAYRLCSQL
jgi:hypothetical protein